MICNSDGENGIRFTGTDGEVFVNREKIETKPAELATMELKPNDVHLYKSENHQKNFLECVKTRKDPICCIEIGHRSVTMCHLGNLAIRLNRRIQWDPDKEQMVGDEEAQAWQTRPRRSPYELPSYRPRVRQAPARSGRRSFFGKK